MKHTFITLTLLLCATLSFAQELKVKSFTLDQMSLEARVGGGRKDLNGKQCALIKVQVRDDIVDCTGGNVGEIISLIFIFLYLFFLICLFLFDSLR